MQNSNESLLVSIICPSFNSSTYIAQTIRSVLDQSHQNFELIIVDDCSTDNTVEIIRSFAHDNRIILHRLLINSGAAIARNTAIEKAKGDFIAFIDSDDLWQPDKLATQIEFMKSNHASLSYSEFSLIDHHGTRIGRSQTLPKSVSYSELLKHCVIQNSTAMYDIHICGKIYCPKIQKRQDFGLFLAILRNGAIAHLVTDTSGSPLNLASYRIRPGSVSSNKFKNIPMQWSVYRNIEKISLIGCVYYMAMWMTSASIKNALRFIKSRQKGSE